MWGNFYFGRGRGSSRTNLKFVFECFRRNELIACTFGWMRNNLELHATRGVLFGAGRTQFVRDLSHVERLQSHVASGGDGRARSGGARYL